MIEDYFFISRYLISFHIIDIIYFDALYFTRFIIFLSSFIRRFHFRWDFYYQFSFIRRLLNVVNIFMGFLRSWILIKFIINIIILNSF